MSWPKASRALFSSSPFIRTLQPVAVALRSPTVVTLRRPSTLAVWAARSTLACFSPKA